MDVDDQIERALRTGHREMRAAVLDQLALLSLPAALRKRLRELVVGLEPTPGRGQVAVAEGSAWFQTYGNLAFELLEPEPALVSPDDIAHSLAMQCRFNGHTPDFYSVAQHSCLVAGCLMETLDWHPRSHRSGDAEDVRKQAIVRWGLFHDAAECYIGDMIRPLKKRLPEFVRLFEEPIEKAIGVRFGLPWPMPPEIKVADMRVLAAERKFLRPAPPRPLAADEQVEPWPASRFMTLEPRLAEQGFTDLYRRLYYIGEAAR